MYSNVHPVQRLKQNNKKILQFLTIFNVLFGLEFISDVFETKNNLSLAVNHKNKAMIKYILHFNC